MPKEPPRLGGDLIARKGEAAPAVVSAPVREPESTSLPPTRMGSPVPKGLSGTIAVTVRLDPERYERLKIHGAKQRRTNQEILVAALDAYLPGEARPAEK